MMYRRISNGVSEAVVRYVLLIAGLKGRSQRGQRQFSVLASRRAKHLPQNMRPVFGFSGFGFSLAWVMRIPVATACLRPHPLGYFQQLYHHWKRSPAAMEFDHVPRGR